MSRTRARVRKRQGKEARVLIERPIPPASAGRESRVKVPSTTSNSRIGINAALLVVSLLGAVLQLIEFAHHVPGEHRLWLFVYLFVVVYAGGSLYARLRARQKGV